MVDAIRLQQDFNFESAASRHHAHMHSWPAGHQTRYEGRSHEPCEPVCAQEHGSGVSA